MLDSSINRELVSSSFDVVPSSLTGGGPASSRGGGCLPDHAGLSPPPVVAIQGRKTRGRS